MEFSLTLLGTSGALPLPHRFATAQALQVGNQYYLIDCGEGTQMQLQSYQVPAVRIRHIFISHLHGDHIFGLPGLLSSFDLFDRRQPLVIHAPAGLADMVLPMLAVKHHKTLGYPITFQDFDPEVSTVIHTDSWVTVRTLPLQHRIAAAGFLFQEQERQPTMLTEKIQEYQLTIPQIIAAKRGKAVTLPDGRELPASAFTLPAPAPRSYAYCSDTAYTESLLPLIKGVDLLYHESTFLDADKERAVRTGHSTARDAGRLARLAEVGQLILGHYSPRYPDPQAHTAEAKQEFSRVTAGDDGMVFSVPFRPRLH